MAGERCSKCGREQWDGVAVLLNGHCEKHGDANCEMAEDLRDAQEDARATRSKLTKLREENARLTAKVAELEASLEAADAELEQHHPDRSGGRR